MKIKTTRFGTITIEEDKIIGMPFGMLGFPDKRRFVMLQHSQTSPFFWYQSVDDPALAFVIASPFLCMPDYQVDTEELVNEMAWEVGHEGNNLELYVVVTIPKDSPEKITANLIGPIVINNKVRQAVQAVLSNSLYSHKFSLIQEH